MVCILLISFSIPQPVITLRTCPPHVVTLMGLMFSFA